MTINRDAEENIRKSVKNIEERLKFYEKNYAIKDRQDLLAMCLIEIATKLANVIKMPYRYGLYLNPFLTARPNQIKTMTNMVAA